eukprot:gb/GECG01001105.1/.p1 GENE.gb/GECG01001105.1/~~gb/GECG01001105.1/.p1  ORF type:complete len:1102 (+),score=162.58 gb/GECG01001105.1/:1-3306(+)
MRRLLVSSPRWRPCFRRCYAGYRSYTGFSYSPEVQSALNEGRAKQIVALESTIISHGMPYPQNVETARTVEEIVRSQGAIPATIAILHGKIHVGLSDTELEVLGTAENVRKCSRRDIAYAVAMGSHGATTVASTMLLAHRSGIRLFVTGGIGGVHREYNETMDMSADLTELARTPVTVVCAGVKSILDIPRTLEILETYGVPVAGWKCDEFPAFFTNNSGVECPLVFHNEEAVAKTMVTSDYLGIESGMLLGVPNPNPADAELVKSSILRSLEEADEHGIHGKDVTPYVLRRVNEMTKGASLKSNIELVKNNALVGGKITAAYSSSSRESKVCSYSTAAATTDNMPEKRDSSLPEVYPIIFGGAVVDLTAKPHPGQKFQLHTSNPGVLQQSFGGVGSNIAVALSRLKHYPAFITAIGDDGFAGPIRAYLQSQELEYFNGLDFDGSLRGSSANAPKSAVYSAMLDEKGDLVGAIADMSCFEEITDASIQKFYNRIRASSVTIADANFNVAALNSICNAAVSVAQLDLVYQMMSHLKHGKEQGPITNRLEKCLELSLTPEQRMSEIDSIMEDCSNESLLESVALRKGVPVWFEPTSLQKGKRLASFEALCKVAVVSPNADEAIAMAESLDDDSTYDAKFTDESGDELTTENAMNIEEYANQHGLDISSINVSEMMQSLATEDAQRKMEEAGVTMEEVQAVLQRYTTPNQDEENTARLIDPSEGVAASSEAHEAENKESIGMKRKKDNPRKKSKGSTSSASVPSAWKTPKARVPKADDSQRQQKQDGSSLEEQDSERYTAVSMERDFSKQSSETTVHKGYKGDKENQDVEQEEGESSALTSAVLEAGQKILAAMCNPLSEELLVGTVDGMKHVLITLGEEGVLWLSSPPCRDEEMFWKMYSSSFFQASIETGFDFALYKPPSATVHTCTGAGDNFVAGVVHAISEGKSMDEAVLYGLGAAKCAIESEESVPLDLSSSKLESAYLEAVRVNDDSAEAGTSGGNGPSSTGTQGDRWSALASSLLKRQDGRAETPIAMEDLNHQISNAMAQDAVREGDSGTGAGLYHLMEDIHRNAEKQVNDFRTYRDRSRRNSHYNARYLGTKKHS